MIEDDFRLRLIDLGIDLWREVEHSALHRLYLDLLRELQDALRIGRGGDDKTHRETVAARECRGHYREHLNARDLTKLLCTLWQISCRRGFANAPGL